MQYIKRFVSIARETKRKTHDPVAVAVVQGVERERVARGIRGQKFLIGSLWGLGWHNASFSGSRDVDERKQQNLDGEMETESNAG